MTISAKKKIRVNSMFVNTMFVNKLKKDNILII